MKVLLLFVFSFLQCTFSIRLIDDVPAFLWGSQSIISQSEDRLEDMTSADLASLLQSFVTDKDSTGFAKRVPEVMVLYLEHQLRTDEVTTAVQSEQLSTLKGTIESSDTQSITLPFVDMKMPLVGYILDIARSFPQSSHIIYSGEASHLLEDLQSKLPISVTHLNLDHLEDEIDQSIFSNGVTDLLIVNLRSKTEPKFTYFDSVLKRIQPWINKQSKGSYIAMYSALLHQHLDVWSNIELDEKRNLLSDVRMRADGNHSNPNEDWFQRAFPGWFWMSFFVVLLVLAISSFGVCFLAQAQTFERLPDKNHK